nr:hypothetical protein [Tanacetum cinerariifolium]
MINKYLSLMDVTGLQTTFFIRLLQSFLPMPLCIVPCCSNTSFLLRVLGVKEDFFFRNAKAKDAQFFNKQRLKKEKYIIKVGVKSSKSEAPFFLLGMYEF